MLTIDEILRNRIRIDVINTFSDTYFNYTEKDVEKEIDNRLDTFVTDLYDNYIKKE
jgi:hypothetical protein